MGDRNRRITWILGPASLGYTDEIDCLKQDGKCLLALSVTSGCHMGSRTCRLTTRMHMCIQKDNANSFWWHEAEGSKLLVSLEHLPFFTVGNKYMESWWCQCKKKYFPRGLVLKKSCVRHMAYLLLLIDFQVKSSLIFVYSWPRVRNIN